MFLNIDLTFNKKETFSGKGLFSFLIIESDWLTIID